MLVICRECKGKGYAYTPEFQTDLECESCLGTGEVYKESSGKKKDKKQKKFKKDDIDDEL